MTTRALFIIRYEGRTQDEYLALLTGAGERVTLTCFERENAVPAATPPPRQRPDNRAWAGERVPETVVCSDLFSTDR